MQNQNQFFFFSVFGYASPFYTPNYTQIPQEQNFYAQLPTQSNQSLIPLQPQPKTKAEIPKNNKKEEEVSNLILEKRTRKKKYSRYFDSDQSLKQRMRLKEKRGKAQKKKKYAKCQNSFKKNATSNILRNFFRCFLELKQYDYFINKAFTYLGIRQQIYIFYNWLKTYHISSRGFINRQILIEIFKQGTQPGFQKVFLMALKHYLNQESICCILTSKRYIYKNSQLSSRRVLLNILQDVVKHPDNHSKQDNLSN